MIDNVHFKAKFFNSKEALPVSMDECIKDVVDFKDNIVHVHYETKDPNLYCFTIFVNNSLSPFSTIYFLQSLYGSIYEPLIKDVE